MDIRGAEGSGTRRGAIGYGERSGCAVPALVSVGDDWGLGGGWAERGNAPLGAFGWEEVCVAYR